MEKYEGIGRWKKIVKEKDVGKGRWRKKKKNDYKKGKGWRN